MSYAELEPLETQQAYLSHTLNQLLASTVHTLAAPINNLSLSLDQHAKSAKKDEPTNLWYCYYYIWNKTFFIYIFFI